MLWSCCQLPAVVVKLLTSSSKSMFETIKTQISKIISSLVTVIMRSLKSLPKILNIPQSILEYNPVERRVSETRICTQVMYSILGSRAASNPKLSLFHSFATCLLILYSFVSGEAEGGEDSAGSGLASGSAASSGVAFTLASASASTALSFSSPFESVFVAFFFCC